MRTSFLSPSRIRVMLAALLVVACDTGTVGFSGPNGRNGGGPTGPDSTAGLTLTINPNPIRISVGKTGQFSSRLQDALGNVISGTVTWGSNNLAVATVDASGLATGVGAGSTTITASEQGLTTSASIEVDPVPVASVAVSPRLDTLQVGTQVTLSAVTKDAIGNTLTGRQVTWTSRSPSIATVDAFGTVTAVAVGVDSVLATSEGVTGAAVITVVNVPVVTVVVSPTPDTILQAGTLQLTATPEDGGGNPLVRAVTWSSGSTAIATVNSAGLVTGVGLGTTTLTATSGGIPGTASVTVIQAPVATVTVAPKTPSVQIGKTVQLSATTRDAKGNTLTGRVVTWASGTPGNATVDGTGLVTGAAAGTSVITATSEGINGTATATVTIAPPTLVRIIMSPDTATINTGGTKQFSTVGKYSDSSTSAVTATYSATGGTVTASGLYTAGSTAGTFRVIATASGFADTSTVTVVKVPVALVIVTPALDTVSVGSSYQLTATTKDAGGNVLTGRVVTWGSSNAAVATVSGTGKVTAVAAGTATITATSETIPGTATAVVVVVLAKTVSIAPAGATVFKGSTVGLTATARDQGGNILNHAVTWSSLSPGIATVNGSGTVTGVALGTATIKAVVDTVTATTSVTVDTQSVVQPWLLEDFSGYTSLANMLSDPRGIYSVAEDEGQSQMALDKSVFVDTLNLHLTQSMRYDYIAPGCSSQTVTRNIVLPQNATELWIELWVRWSANFNTYAAPSGCSTPPAHKFLFGRVGPGLWGRWEVEWGNQGPPQQVYYGYPSSGGGVQDQFGFNNANDYWDAKWHRVRIHMKNSTSTSATDGAFQMWVNDSLKVNRTGININVSSYIYGVAIGRNLDQGITSGTMSLWWGYIALFNQDPGWK
ncbi:MAG TPA: Ig-like domain-containing protein [Gemmatimonadales bacterium]|nr:Ig-like domain-containing protein [Gemmatimonadales bacterium]